MMSAKVLFIDRDGTLIEEPEDNQVDAVEKIRLVDDVIPSLLDLANHGYRFVMISNQDGMGTDAFPRDQFDACHDHALGLFSSQGITFDKIFICPHLPDDNCECRKPRTGLLTKYLAATDIDLAASAVIGDRLTDMEMADRIGVRGLLVNTDDHGALTWLEIVELLCYSDRVASVERNTNETRIGVHVNLDTSNPIRINTGIGFYDHMLEQIAKHGGFGLTLECDGDLEIDEHHTVEDCALALGQTLDSALGDRRGIGRYGFTLPMDESLAEVAIDLSGRPAIVFDADFPRDAVGEFSTEMVQHFFASLSQALRAAIHLQVRGENTHHMIEALFKGAGRALKPALARQGRELPSTKGTL